ncbi:MAG: ribonuclease P [Rhodothermaceae bacterium]|nr:ribonuclease P [Rhodothermaceae bacterium]MXZ59196.1 ribonuclease P [Rhodothermaceae bacterium]MYB90226.1 ribonuclease P [Rhodothermaceae bacterium]MYD68598.1 ribonuclease P [Rhodothermaceae bacterium]MYG45730.1 ribonuclease P [Rhodothermaceae bacterium]
MTTVAEQRFPRSMRLKRRRLIAPLFERSASDTKSLVAGSIRILYRFVPRSATGTDAPIQVGFAPGRCRNAVQRNQIKRQMRETWRRNQNLVGLETLPAAETLALMVLRRSPDRNHRLSQDLLQAMHLLHQSLNKGD